MKLTKKLKATPKHRTSRFSETELLEMIKERKSGMKWIDIADGTREGAEICRKAVSAYVNRAGRKPQDSSDRPNDGEDEFYSVEEHLKNGEVEITKKVFFDKNVKKTPDTILTALGYSPEEWTIVSWRLCEWDSATGSGDKTAYSIRGRIKPRGASDMRDVDYFNAAKEFFSKHRIEYRTAARYCGSSVSGIDDDCLIEIPAIELHLGKRSHITDTPENYDMKDAERCFNKIFDTVIDYAEAIGAKGNCLLVIGNDFFNAEFNNQTTNGTPQQNDGRYKKLFIKGMELYTNAIERLIPVFGNIDIRLCQGNHAQSAEFYLYHSLSQYFRNAKNVHFSDNYRTTQAYVFGDVGIFFTHGDENEKRTIASIPAEFPEEWGKTKFRELHLGHLHKEGATITEMGGMITRRIPSPCAADDWHYNKRFIGNQRCHQFFVWHRTKGLVATNYVNV